MCVEAGFFQIRSHFKNDFADWKCPVATFTTLCTIPAECVEGLSIQRKTTLCQMTVTAYSTAFGMCPVAINHFTVAYTEIHMQTNNTEDIGSKCIGYAGIDPLLSLADIIQATLGCRSLTIVHSLCWLNVFSIYVIHSDHIYIP